MDKKRVLRVVLGVVGAVGALSMLCAVVSEKKKKAKLNEEFGLSDNSDECPDFVEGSDSSIAPCDYADDEDITFGGRYAVLYGNLDSEGDDESDDFDFGDWDDEE